MSAVDNRLFAVIDFSIAAASAVIWLASPEAGAKPLLVGMLPWAIRLAAGRFPFRRTKLDPLIAVLLLTAIVATWAAYRREIGMARFWLLVGGVLIFYAWSCPVLVDTRRLGVIAYGECHLEPNWRCV